MLASVASLVSSGAPPGAGRDTNRSAAERARVVLDHYRQGGPGETLGQQVLPVREELAALLPQRGLRRGSTVVVRGSTSVLLALVAEATANGSWAAVVGMPDLGILAANELGVALQRLALVPNPGAEFASVVAALLDGIDLVVVSATGLLGGQLSDGLARRLSARTRHRKSVLIPFGSWPNADLELDCVGIRWAGIGYGHGYLTEQKLVLSVRGRGAAARPIRGHVRLPGKRQEVNQEAGEASQEAAVDLGEKVG